MRKSHSANGGLPVGILPEVAFFPGKCAGRNQGVWWKRWPRCSGC